MKINFKYQITFTRAVLIFLVLSTASLFAQKPVYKPIVIGCGLNCYSSGNAHGMFYAPSISISVRRNSFQFAPIIQKRSMVMNGFKVSYTRNLSSESPDVIKDYGYDLLQINFFSSLQYNGKLPLSYYQVKEENCVTREPQTDWNTVKLSTVEAAAGFELQINISKTICWKNYVGASAYYHLNYVQGMDHARVAPSLVLGTGIHILIP